MVVKGTQQQPALPLPGACWARTIQVFEKIDRASRTHVEIDLRRLCSKGGSEWSGKDDCGTIVHREHKAALRGFRIERGCAVEGGLPTDRHLPKVTRRK